MKTLSEALTERFGETPGGTDELDSNAALRGIATRRSIRRYAERPVEGDLVRSLAALALCAPSKSDLQQRDIVIVEDPSQRAALGALFPNEPNIAGAPVFLVFCGNHRRLRLIQEWRGRTFANDHLDSFFNTAVDAGIALATFVTAAEAAGLGCCPISIIRNRAREVAELLELPGWVFPLAGLTLGWPADEGELSQRLPLSATVHTDRYDETGLEQAVDDYDRARHAVRPFARQRLTEAYGEQDFYGWSEDKARQFSRPQRADFGAYIRDIGFKLD